MSYNTRSKGGSDPDITDSRRKTKRPGMGTRGLDNKENAMPSKLKMIAKKTVKIDTVLMQSTSGTISATQKKYVSEVVVSKCCGTIPQIPSRTPLLDRNDKPGVQYCNTKNCPVICGASNKKNVAGRPSRSDNITASGMQLRNKQITRPLAHSTVTSSRNNKFNPYSAVNSHLRNNQALPKAAATVISRSSSGTVPKNQTTETSTSQIPTILEHEPLHIPSRTELSRTVCMCRGSYRTPESAAWNDSTEDSVFFSYNVSSWVTFNPTPNTPQDLTAVRPCQIQFMQDHLSAPESELIIHDGIPSVRKITLKRYVAASSSYKGVVNLDPHEVKVSPTILYSEYMIDIIKNMLKKEDHLTLPKQFLDQTNILRTHRTSLVNWLHKLHQHLGSDPGVFFLSVQILDNLLCSLTVAVNNLQLLAVISFWVAHKFDDIVGPIQVDAVLKFCNNIYPLNYVLQAEKQVLQVLNYNILSFEEPLIFVRYYINLMEIEYCNKVFFCANYLLDCLSLSSDINTFPLSLQGSGSVYLALKLLGYQTTNLWCKLKNYPGFHASENLYLINERIIEKVLLVQDNNFEYRQPFHKYSSEKYGCVSMLIYTELNKL